MPYSNNPGTVPRDKVYIELGLTDPTQSLLTDEEVDYYLERAQDDTVNASVAAARMILFKLAQMTRFRNDTLEVFASDQMKQWQQALEMYIAANDPESSKRSLATAFTKANGYAGGISLIDIQTNEGTADNNFVPRVKDKEISEIPGFIDFTF
jgi:hypothetical protein